MSELPGTEESYWMDSAPPATHPALTGDAEADVVVIGGGIAGLSTTWELTERGLRVHLSKRTGSPPASPVTRLGVSEIAYRWAAQDNTSTDRIPFVGPLHPGTRLRPLHPPGLHRPLQRRRDHLGVPVPRLPLHRGRSGAAGPRHRTPTS
ncbi:hypothetical protein GCM10025331_19480 [Actinoplanes utahensis]|uniref:FAD dependent oxidoreductase domain-containing protein n=1 Tax=Actinoplanes utahensis TaxID=1869 RepID=A0A0A6UFN9_ACTUT|nr:hypothetical protein MB27_26180 [Actinoplanes utahensis]GIF30804.1 hypothetical protein Aut01nite_37900 [Actinoplanes utahensis]